MFSSTFLLKFFLLITILPSINLSPSTSKCQQQEALPPPPPPIPRLLIFSFDGFRADALSPSITPTLYRLAATGVTGTMKPSFPSKTFPNHHSIATGLYQPYHGVIHNSFIDPIISGSVESKNPEKFSVNNSSSFWWDMFNASVPLYIANQVFEPIKRFSGALQWPGAISTYTGGALEKNPKDPEEPQIRHRVHHLLPFNQTLNWTAAIDRVIDMWILSPNNPANLVLLYFPEPDTTSHHFGPFSSQVRQQLVKLDQAVAYFLDRLASEALDSSTNLLFISDHGMAEITPARVIYLEKCAKTYGIDLRYLLFGGSPVYSIVPLSAPKKFLNNCRSNVVLAVQSVLNQCSRALFQSKFTVYQQTEIPSEYNYSGNRRILDLFLLAEDGYEVKYSEGDGKRISQGNHGFNNSLPSMQPLFIGHGPAFKPGGYHHNLVFENVDLYPLALELLGIPGNLFPSNGSLARVAGLLQNGIMKDNIEKQREKVFGKLRLDVEDEIKQELHFCLHTKQEKMAQYNNGSILTYLFFVIIFATIIFFSFFIIAMKLTQKKVSNLIFKNSKNSKTKSNV